MTGVTRAEAAAGTLREAILNGRYLSGERLTEIRIAQRLDVSQNTVRDALRILEQEGWVVKNPRRGVYVRAFSAADAAEVCALIAAVEALALAGVIEQNDKSLRADLHGLVAGARKSALAGERRAAFGHLLRIHEHINAAAGKPLTGQFLETLYNQVRLLEALRQARAPRTPDELDAQIEAHEALLRAIDASDAEAASQRLGELIDRYSSATVSALRL